MKVYVVTQGDYSDYRLVALFSDREVAEAVATEGAVKAVSDKLAEIMAQEAGV